MLTYKDFYSPSMLSIEEHVEIANKLLEAKILLSSITKLFLVQKGNTRKVCNHVFKAIDSIDCYRSEMDDLLRRYWITLDMNEELIQKYGQPPEGVYYPL